MHCWFGRTESIRATRVFVVLSTFNRCASTLTFLSSLQRELDTAGVAGSIVLVDDHSSDGTTQAVAEQFPDVELIHGDGSLYWAGSVRRAMAAIDSRLDEADGILLANDDIQFEPGALGEMIELARDRHAIVGGAVYTRDGQVEATGGRFGRICRPKQRLIAPSGAAQRCDLLPAHVMYIPVETYRRLGPFDPQFIHGHIDLEYGVRAGRAGVPLLIAPHVVARVEQVHNYQRDVARLDLTAGELWWRLRYHPKSPPLRETVRYLRMISPIAWPLWVAPYYRGYIVAIARAAGATLISLTTSMARSRGDLQQ